MTTDEAPRRARSLVESMLWMDAHGFVPTTHVAHTEEAPSLHSWEALAPSGERIRLCFLISGEPTDEWLLGSGGPSELLTPSDLAAIAVERIRNTPARPAGFVREAADAMVGDLALAVACLAEVTRFIPQGEHNLPADLADGVPDDLRSAAGIAEACEAVDAHLKNIKEFLPKLSPCRPLAEHPAADNRLPDGMVARMKTSPPPSLGDLTEGFGPWHLVHHDGSRALFRHGGGAALRVNTGGADSPPSATPLEGAAALEALAERAFNLLPEDHSRLRQVIVPGVPMERALEDAFPAPDVVRPLPGLKSAGEEVRFFQVEKPEVHRSAALALILDSEGAIKGYRLMEGPVALEQLTVLHEVAGHLPGPSGEPPETESMKKVTAAMEVVVSSVSPILESLLRGDLDPASLAPRPGDFEAVFRGPMVDAIASRYRALWEEDTPRVKPSRGNEVEIQVGVCTGGGFQQGLPPAADFPPGYRDVAEHMQPHRTWVSWTYLPEGARRGSSHDGLVWVDDHWAWFPRPDRVIPSCLPPS